MNWDDLLCAETLAKDPLPDPEWTDTPLDAFEKDYKDVITSFLFRRLQDKTQIFSLDRGDYVRTRLTHSLEVSTIGSQLGVMVSKTSEQKESLAPLNEKPDFYANKFSTILKTAGLLHDLGNPPFGHYGEKVISMYFREALSTGRLKYKGNPLSSILSDRMQADLKKFDGNAQTMHLLLKAKDSESRYNPNLTYGLLSAMVKYTAGSLDIDSTGEDQRRHKHGYLLADEKLVHEIRQKTLIEQPGITCYSRNPLTFLLEASDDIAYVCSDIEDSIQRGIFSPLELSEYFLQVLNEMPEEGEGLYDVQIMSSRSIFELFNERLKAAASEHERKSEVVLWLKRVKSWLMHSAAYSFCENADEILNGTYQGEIIADSYHKYTVEIMKSAMVKFVYISRPKLRVELASNKILTSLLDNFVPAAISWNSGEKVDSLTDGFSHLIPHHLKQDYELTKTGNEEFDLYLRILMAVDYISGMTDSYAAQQYQQLNGLNI